MKIKGREIKDNYRNILVGLLIVSGYALASSADKPSVNPQITDLISTGKESKHHFSLGLEGSHYKYEETVNGTRFMEMKAFPMVGINGSYTYNPSPLDLSVDARYQYGKGNYSSNGTGKIGNKIDNHLFETKATVGYSFCPFSGTKVTPYTGLGYRYKADYMDGLKTNTGHIGYDRINHLFYLPLGFKLGHPLPSNWRGNLKLEYDHLLQGTHKSEITVDSKTSSATKKQKKGYGLKAEYLLSYDHYSFGPYVHYWNIKNSEKKNIGGGYWLIEPKNKTTEIGMKVAYTF